MTDSAPLKILQVLPALNGGGVERGTLEFARELVNKGHTSMVLSNGGRMVPELEREGSTHYQLPVHKKTLLSLRWVRPVRRLILELKPDIIHVRSRLPAWIVWLAWRGIPEAQRPGLVTTFHGMYSVNPYSAVMAKGQRIIAISQCVKAYILKNYPVSEDTIRLVHRGVDLNGFTQQQATAAWRKGLHQQYPTLKGKQIILMPGRLTRWKGQEQFIEMMALLIKLNPDCHGVVVGDAEATKRHYRKELKDKVDALGLNDDITFVGHRSDMQSFYALAKVVCHMSNKPEPFGRTVTEALAVGTPVVGFDRGGASESLQACFPQGLVEPDNLEQFSERVNQQLDFNGEIKLPQAFLLAQQVKLTLAAYRELLDSGLSCND